MAAQIDSILSQLPRSGRLYVRDDGSQDRSLEIVASFKDPRVTVTRGKNLGFGLSFLTLLQQVPEDVEMAMFSDQDDVWLPGKIERAWDFLLPHSRKPAIYGSAQTLVDEHLNVIGVTPPWPRGPSLRAALTENIITGCTSALNLQAIALLQQVGVPRNVFFHDWWCYLVTSAFGTVVYDEESRILYRQHGANQIGHGIGWFGRQLGILRFLSRHDWVGIMLGQVHAFAFAFDARLPIETRTLITRYFDLGAETAAARWRIVFGVTTWRQTLSKEILFRALVGAHKLRLWPLRRSRFGISHQ